MGSSKRKSYSMDVGGRRVAVNVTPEAPRFADRLREDWRVSPSYESPATIRRMAKKIRQRMQAANSAGRVAGVVRPSRGRPTN